MYGRWGARGVYFHESHWCEGYITFCTGGQARSCFSCLKCSLCMPNVKTKMCMNQKQRSRQQILFPCDLKLSIICSLPKYCIGLTLFIILLEMLSWMTCDIIFVHHFFHHLHNNVHKRKYLSRTNQQDDLSLSDSSQTPTPSRKYSGSCIIGINRGISPRGPSFVWSGN